MNTSTTEGFFSIQLSPEGAQYLLRIYKLNRWVFGLSTLFYLISITSSLYFFTRYHEGTTSKLDMLFSFILSPLFWAVMNTLWLTHTWLFLRFNRVCKKAIETGQSDLFNQSFKWMYRNMVIALIQLVMEIPFSVITFIGQLLGD